MLFSTDYFPFQTREADGRKTEQNLTKKYLSTEASLQTYRLAALRHGSE